MKRRVDDLFQLQWTYWQKTHSQLCRCGHALWEHDGIAVGCCHLGTCPCKRFTNRRRRATKSPMEER